MWDTTWNRIGEFLPQLKDELFRNEGISYDYNQFFRNTSYNPSFPVHQSHNISALLPPTSQLILPPPAFDQQAHILPVALPAPILVEATPGMNV